MQVSHISISVGKEVFITVLSDGNLLLEVMKHELRNIEAALRYAIKVEAYEQYLVCQGTLAAVESRAKHRSHNVYAVSDQSDAGENATLQKRIDELQEMLEQATKVSQHWPLNRGLLQRQALLCTKKSPSKGVIKSCGAGQGKFG